MEDIIDVLTHKRVILISADACSHFALSVLHGLRYYEYVKVRSGIGLILSFTVYKID